MRPSARLRIRGLLAVAVLLVVAGCAASASPAAAVLSAVPTQLLDRGVAWHRGAVGAEFVLEALQLPGERAVATVVSGPPAVTLLRHPDAGAVPGRLEELGLEPVDTDVLSARMWRRPDAADGPLGLPAVGVLRDLVVVGDVAEVRSVLAAADGPEGPVPVDLLDGAQVAVVGTAAATIDGALAAEGRLPAYEVFIVTATPSGAGAIALVVPGATQDDAVELAVRARTAVLGEGLAASVLLRPVEPLATGDRVVLGVEWLVDPSAVLGSAVDDGFTALLRPDPGG